MKVESSFVIDGNIVSKVFEANEIVIYQGESDWDTFTYIANKDGEVICKMFIECGMSQAIGYVEKITYSDK